MKTTFSCAAVLSFAALALLFPAASARATQGTDATSGSKVLQEVKAHAGEAYHDAELLDSYTRSNLDWKDHAERLHEIRGHVNDLFKDYSRLQKITDQATPQQREAIKRLEPMLLNMANSLNQTIQTLNENQRRVNFPAFRDRIHTDYANIENVYRELCKCTEKKSA